MAGSPAPQQHQQRPRSLPSAQLCQKRYHQSRMGLIHAMQTSGPRRDWHSPSQMDMRLQPLVTQRPPHTSCRCGVGGAASGSWFAAALVAAASWLAFSCKPAEVQQRHDSSVHIQALYINTGLQSLTSSLCTGWHGLAATCRHTLEL